MSSAVDRASSALGFASGGRVRGPGTSTSDSILARLSDGEYVIRADAVAHYGPQLFDLLNRMRLPPRALQGLQGGGSDLLRSLTASLTGFRAGGLVSAPVPALATGGPAPSGGGSYATLNLTIGGQTFAGLMAPRQTAEQLLRFARTEEVKSAGRRPNWYGGT